MFGSQHAPLDRGLIAFDKRRWRAARRYLEDAEHEDRRPIGDYHLGLLYWRGLGGERDASAAVARFKRAAESGHAGAQTALGIALLTGPKAEKNAHIARALFRSAAGAGDIAAMTQLARISPKHEAHSLLERAADCGYAAAMQQLSEMVLLDDVVEAMSWLYISAIWNGDEASAQRAKQLAQEMNAEEISRAQRRGRDFLAKLKREAAH